jgi:hypothetical protein
MKLTGLVLVVALLAGCATSGQNLFSGRAVIELDQAQFFVTYVSVAMNYSVFKYQITQLCVAKTLDQATCDNATEADKKIQRIHEEIMTALQNPKYPLDMAKLQSFIDMVLVTMMKVGVKGIAL